MSKPVVCIDAGHFGKYNVCPKNYQYYESEVMWKLHILQKKYLEKLGIEVVTTRDSSSEDLSLYSRGTKAKGCDLFISNHTNAVGTKMNEDVDYVAVYHLVNDTKVKCDDVSKEVANLLAPLISKTMCTKQGYKVLTRKSDKDKDGDGVLNDNYYGVLHASRSVNVAGLILEHSFHTNTRAVTWLLNNTNLDKLARLEAECIASYLLGKSVSLPPTNTNSSKFNSYKVKVTANVLNVRKGAGTNYSAVSKIYKNEVYTIVAEVMNGSTKWGKLKSGAGWISLAYTKKV